jgi:alkylated DNA repair dioxygenase AlkB
MASSKYTSTFTLTYGDCAENHKGMQMIGKMADKGFTHDDLKKTMKWFEEQGCECEIIELSNNDLCELPKGTPLQEAYLLIVRNGVNAILKEIEKTADDYYKEQDKLPKDTKAFMYGRVVNKNARHNLCFGEEYQAPDYETGKGTIIAFKDVPCLDKIRTKLPEIMGKCAEKLVVEGNYYYDIKKCGIGYHGDTERTKVVGVRLGATLPICYQWYHKSKPVGKNMRFEVNHGDIYVMSEKTVGQDWKRSSIFTLRHAAGSDKFIIIEEKS